MSRCRDACSSRRRAVAIAGVLLVASLVPARHDPPRPPPAHLDKVAHFVGHAVFAAALFDVGETSGRSARTAVVAVALSAGYGLGLELLQRRVPGRRFERGDVVAAALGSVGGGGVAWAQRHRRRRSHSRAAYSAGTER